MNLSIYLGPAPTRIQQTSRQLSSPLTSCIAQALCTDSNILKAVLSAVNDHWIRPFFEASVLLDLHLNAQGLALYQTLQSEFPKSDYLTAQVAVAHYNLREYDISESQFEGMLKTDPYRIENMDVYSNILYVKESAPALSYLAHKVRTFPLQHLLSLHLNCIKIGFDTVH